MRLKPHEFDKLKKIRKNTTEIRAKSINKKLDLWFFNRRQFVSDIFEAGGIYFLYNNKEIVYIGESKNMVHRIIQHTNNTSMIFDEFKMWRFGFSKKQRQEKERELIIKFMPKYNIDYINNAMYVY